MIIKDLRIDKIEQLTYKDIQDIIASHGHHELPRLRHLQMMYEGKHLILERQGEANKPNNKLVADFCGKVVDTENGYFLGKPVVLNFHEEDKEAEEYIRDLLIENEFEDLLMEVGKETSIKGLSSIMMYQNEDSETRLCKVSPENAIFINKSNGTEVGVAIRLWSEINIDEEKTIHVEVYDDEKVLYLKIYDGVISLDNTVEGPNPRPHIFGIVPIIPVVNNEECLGSFEKVATLIDAYDKLLSDTSNEHEAYRNAYLVFKNLTADDSTLEKLKQHGTIEVYDDGDVHFVSKPILDGAINSHLDRLNANIHKFVDVPDLTDEAFAGNLSGVAIKFKLFGLETKCIIKERKLTKALRRVLKGLKRVLEIDTGNTFNVNKVQMVYTRNIPMNVLETTQVVTSLKGIVDMETLLSLLPFVENPEEIVEKLKLEQDDYANDMQRYNSMDMSLFNQSPNLGEEDNTDLGMDELE